MTFYNADVAPDGTMTVYGVPIFVECQRERGGDEVFMFDAEWIAAAVKKAMVRQEDGYLPPLHIRHHEPSTDANDSVRASGFFRITGTQEIRFKGQTKLAILADLIVTDPQTQEDILAKRLPYRSVEIFNVDDPGIDSLALLDHEAPFLELPMLMVRGVGATASATFQRTSRNVVGKSANIESNPILLFDNNEVRMACGPKETKMQDEEKKPEGEMEAAPMMDVAAMVKAIEEGSIAVADMEAIVAAIEARKAAVAPTVEETPVEAPMPVEDKMSALASENEVLRAKLATLQLETTAKQDVSEAMRRLNGRVLGSSLETRLLNFRKEFGAAAFARHIADLEASVAPSGKPDKAALFAAAAPAKASAAAMKYAQQGADVLEQAIRFSREWQSLRDHGHCRQSEERYIEININRLN